MALRKTIEEEIVSPEDVNEIVKPVNKKKGWKKFLVKLILLAILLAVGAYFLFKYSKTDSYRQNKAKRETASLVRQVGSLMVLPQGTPAIFVVQDPDVLAGQQAFFKGAEKGDSLLVYAEAGKAIIYSKRRNMIVNVGPVTFDQKEPAQKKQ